MPRLFGGKVRGTVGIGQVDCCGQGKHRSGGLILMWRSSVTVEILSFSNNHIDIKVTTEEVKESLWVSCVYGFPESDLKFRTLDIISQLKKDTNVAWLLLGDMNQVFCLEGKVGGNPVNMNEVNRARNCIDQVALKDMDFCGYRFTWSNKRKIPHTVEERVDRALGNQRWHDLWHLLVP
ncbi:hypothetical protein RIF29_25131 [Crotalaria pallida]|uniref:Endonuclease/exonuclease/phosphatase n=1 Tax=Crotalaria pallida TaxID=3830 RepID=A0AAN9HZ10_CROPI